MDNVKLLERIDTKYVLHEQKLVGLLAEINDKYRLLVIEDVAVHPYETVYFDTPEFNLYMMHHNGRRNRYKLRCRKYVNSGDTFFEIKRKTNTSRTIKKRIEIENMPDSLSDKMKQYVTDNASPQKQNYVPSLQVFFDRLTFVNIEGTERLTIDLNVRYKSHQSEAALENIVIVEVKQEKHSVSPFRMLMKQQRQQKTYISKYCLGLISTNHDLKMNRFKEKISYINKLGHETD